MVLTVAKFFLLFLAGAYDNKIVMWDIGGLDRDYSFKTRFVFVPFMFYYASVSEYCFSKPMPACNVTVAVS